MARLAAADLDRRARDSGTDAVGYVLTQAASALSAYDHGARTVYHGTSLGAAAAILDEGIDEAGFSRVADFGPRFYVTTSWEDAKHHAGAAARREDTHAAVLVFSLPEDMDPRVLNACEEHGLTFASRRGLLDELDMDLTDAGILSNGVTIGIRPGCGRLRALRQALRRVEIIPLPRPA